MTQEAFIKAYRALPSFRGDSAFYTWLYRIGINTAKNYLVAMGRRAPTTTEIDSEEAEGFEDGDQLRDLNTPENEMVTRQIAETVNQTLGELPEELRTAITLREIEGLSYEDIANIMNCPIGTVRSRIFRAREAIAAKLDRCWAPGTTGDGEMDKISALMDGELDGSPGARATRPPETRRCAGRLLADFSHYRRLAAR